MFQIVNPIFAITIGGPCSLRFDDPRQPGAQITVQFPNPETLSAVAILVEKRNPLFDPQTGTFYAN